MTPEKGARDVSWYLDREGRLCYYLLNNCPNPPKHIRSLDAIAPTLFEMESIVKGSDMLWREWKRLTNESIDGDYMGPLRGETNCALNCIRALKCIDKITEKELGSEKYHVLHEKAMDLRKRWWPNEYR